VGVGGDQTVHALLYVRDACRLIPSGPEVPPPLTGAVETIDTGLSPTELGEASEAWVQWWRRWLHIEGTSERGDPGTLDRTHRSALRTERGTGFDPPEFEGLGGCEPLRQAARLAVAPALAWWADNWPQIPPQGMAMWTSARTVAESIIEEFQVSPERVCAGVIVLAVAGRWSNHPEPGVLACSAQTFSESRAFEVELRRAFTTGLSTTPPS
jgi:hypothetical protein